MNRAEGGIGPSDADLVRQAREGDADAFAVLVARYQDRVFNTCYRLCHDHADALDLTQSAFLKALEALPRFEARANFYTWIYRIAVNLALSARRASRRRRHASLDDPDACERPRVVAAPPERFDVARGAAERELVERLEQALAKLEAPFRVAVVLKDIEGMDYATIAEILKVPVGTVKSRIHRGRLMLRELLETEEDREPGHA